MSLGKLISAIRGLIGKQEFEIEEETQVRRTGSPAELREAIRKNNRDFLRKVRGSKNMFERARKSSQEAKDHWRNREGQTPHPSGMTAAEAYLRKQSMKITTTWTKLGE